MEMERFFADLDQRLDEARESDRRQYEEFFRELTPRLEMARRLDRELDRHLARRFNVFEYLRTDELGLSRVIADLLDPIASHGQNALFLRALLKKLESASFLDNLDRCRISVSVEHQIPSGRRIDVVVEIKETEGPDRKAYCLAIENKPYAGDQEKQVEDYLKYLEEEYPEWSILLYLSPTGEGPSEQSIKIEELAERCESRFGIVPYHAGQEERLDEFDRFRVSWTLADWLGECRNLCEAERLRWFLHDAELFCQRTFGGHTMTTDSEIKAIQEFVSSSPDKLRMAQKIFDSWPEIREKVCKRYLEKLCEKIRKKMEEILKEEPPGKLPVGMKVDCQFGDRRNSKRIRMYSENWVEYTTAEFGFTRTAILLEADATDASNWTFCVRSPKSRDKMTDEERSRQDSIVKGLREKLSEGNCEASWLWWKRVDKDYQDWNVLVPCLQQELERGGGNIMSYFADEFINLAQKAVPIVHKIENPNGA